VRHLQADLRVRFSAEVAALTRDDDGWTVRDADGAAIETADRLVLAIPSTQARRLLLAVDADLAASLDAVEVDPVWTWMVSGVTHDPGFDVATEPTSDVRWMAREASRPGRDDHGAWTLHASADWTRRHLERERDDVEPDLRALADRIGVIDPIAIPISALHGDQVTSRSDALGWFEGPTLLEHLETVDPDPESAARGVGARMPVQWVIRPGGDRHHDFRGLAGRIAAGVLRPGDEVAILPGGARSVIDRVERIRSDGEPELLESAEAGRSVVVHLRDQVDVSRGDMICHLDDRPTVGDRFEARICWMGERPLRAGDRVLLKHGTRRTSAIAESIVHALNLTDGAPVVGADRLEMNDLGRIRLRVATPIPHDAFERSRATGRFILMDEATDDTVAAGMIVGDRDRDLDHDGPH
jgi:hypothetical protein